MFQVLKYSILTLTLKVDTTHPHLHFPAKATEVQRDRVLACHTAKKAETWKLQLGWPGARAWALPLSAALHFPALCMPVEQ